MKIGIPTDDKEHISAHFGRSKYFEIFDTETKEKHFIENPHAKEENDLIGHGSLIKVLRDEDVKKIICYNVGMRMENDLKKLGIKVEFSEESEIEKYLN